MILAKRFTFIVEKSWKKMYTYDVISRNHSSWPSLNLSQNVPEGWTNSCWKRPRVKTGLGSVSVTWVSAGLGESQIDSPNLIYISWINDVTNFGTLPLLIPIRVLHGKVTFAKNFTSLWRFLSSKETKSGLFSITYILKSINACQLRLNMEKPVQMSDFIHNGGVITIAVKCTCV